MQLLAGEGGGWNQKKLKQELGEAGKGGGGCPRWEIWCEGKKLPKPLGLVQMVPVHMYKYDL